MKTLSSIVPFESVRSVLALRVQHRLQLHQMDVSTAFLHGQLTEEVYTRQLQDFIEESNEHLICRLKRSIYGLKQSPQCWNHALDGQLKKMQFKQSQVIHVCTYILVQKEVVFL